jgi:hypothetical protein
MRLRDVSAEENLDIYCEKRNNCRMIKGRKFRGRKVDGVRSTASGGLGLSGILEVSGEFQDRAGKHRKISSLASIQENS